MSLEGTKTVAEGARELARLLDEVSNAKLDWNEAQTRFQIIDRLIVDCLGWPRAETRPEGYERGDYTDYELGQPRRAIWEAKRIGRTFDLPANPKRRLVVDLPSVMSTSPEAKEAIEQAQAYCSRRGVEIAVVTNGSQIIAFLAARNDGIPPLDGKSLVIDGHAQLREEFPKVWQALSPQGVAENRLKQLLRLGDQPKVPLLPMILGYLQYDGPHRSVDGFVAGNYILLEMQDWSFSTAAIEWALERASGKEKQLIERSAYKPDHPAAPGRFRITTTGAYYFSVWMAEYSYLEAMWHDTPVFDNATRAFLVARAEDFDLRTRYERAVAFREYLTDVWNGSEFRPAYFNWTIQVSRGQKNFDSLVGFIEQQSRERSGRLAP